MEISEEDFDRIAAEHPDLDSLDLIELVMDQLGDDDGEGFAGDREPRNPGPPSPSLGSLALIFVSEASIIDDPERF